MMLKARHFAAAFLVALILMGAVCGFAMVDLSSEIYMPGEFRSMFQVDSVDGTGIAFTFMGKEYLLGGEYLQQARLYSHQYRGFLPAPARLARQLILTLAER